MRSLKQMFFCFVLVICSTVGNAQSITFTPLHVIVDEMAASNVYETSTTVGFAGSPSKQAERFKRLVNFSEQQLLNLAANHKNAIVRLYAFKALVHNKATIPIEILQQFKRDLEKVIKLSGCVGTETTVKSLAESVIAEEYSPTTRSIEQ